MIASDLYKICPLVDKSCSLLNTAEPARPSLSLMSMKISYLA